MTINKHRNYIKQTQRIEHPNPQTNDYYGVTIAASKDGTWMVTGSPNLALRVGRVFVYKKFNDTYELHQELTAPSLAAAGSYLGLWVAMDRDGTTIAVSAPWTNASDANGFVAVYRRDSSDVWSCDESVDLIHPGLYSFGFHMRLSLDGKTLVVGAPYTDTNTGTVRAYRWSGASWSYVDIPGVTPLTNRYYGRCVSISGNGDVIAIGNALEYVDVVRVDFNAGTYAHLQRLTASDSNPGDAFGSGFYHFNFSGQTIDIDEEGNNIFITSMYRAAPDATYYSGAVYHFLKTDTDYWTERQILTELKPTSYPAGVVDDSYYYYGFFLSTVNSGDSVLVSCQAAQITLQDDGIVFLYDYDYDDTGQYILNNQVQADIPQVGAYFGYMGWLDDNYMLVCASDWDNDAGVTGVGALYLFEILPEKASLGDLRTEMIPRLRFSTVGSGNLIPILNSFLRRAQEYLYWMYDYNDIRLETDLKTKVGENFYDYHDRIEPNKIIQVRVLYNNIWHLLDEGIEFYHDTVVDTRYVPRRYDRRSQLETWPKADTEYLMRIEHFRRLERFKMDSDRVTLDDRLVLYFALALAKEHYQQDDYPTYYAMVEDLLKKRRRRTLGNKRFVIGKVEDAPMPKPVVVDYQ